MSGWSARALPPLVLALAVGACVPPQATWIRRERPVSAPPPPPQSAPPPPVSTEGAGGHGGGGPVHVVQKGETLYRIARQYGVDLDELMDLNQISDPRTLAVGRELVLPPRRERGVDTPVRVSEGTPTRAASAREQAPPPAAVSVGSRPSSPPPAVSTAPSNAAPALAWPVKGVVHSRFGPRGGSRHDGIDIGAPEGTPIFAAADGEVIYAGVQRGYGNLVILRHEGGLVTIYAHNRENLVREGERVRKGQKIATVGRTGRATGPHLHFEVRRGTTPIDPQSVLPRR